jgi:WD40 repeat protein/uncharacterized caspase-like protein
LILLSVLPVLQIFLVVNLAFPLLVAQTRIQLAHPNRLEASIPAADTQPKLVSQLGHSGSVISWAFSHDSKLVASSGSDRKIILWARASGRELWVVNYDSGFLEFSKDDQFLLVGRQRENQLDIALLETASGKVARSFQKEFKSNSADETSAGEKYKLRSVKFSAGGKFIVAAYSDTVLVVEAGSMREAWQSNVSPVIAFSSDDALAVAANSDDLLSLFETLTWKERLTFPQDKRKVSSVAISKNGDFSLTGYEDGAVSLRTLATAGPVQREIVPPRTSNQNKLVNSFEFSPNGDKFLISHSPASTNRRELSSLRDTATGQELFSFLGGAARFSPQGNFVLTREYEGRSYYNTYIWKVSTGQKYWGFKVLSVKDDTEIAGRVSVYAFSFEEKYLVTEFADHDPTILWDLSSRKEAVRLVGTQSGMLQPVLSPDGGQILTGGSDGVAHLWDLDKGTEVASFRGGSWDARTVAFSPDETMILTGSGEIRAGDAIYLHDVRSGKEKGSFGFSYPDNLRVQEQRFPLLSMAISPDNRLVLGSYQRGVALWDVITREEVWKSEEHWIDKVAFSPDSRYFMIAKDDLKLYDVRSHQLIRDFSPAAVTDAPAAPIKLVRAGFSPDSKLIFKLTAGRLREDGLTLQMFDRESKDRVFSLSGIDDFSFTRDGKLVLSWVVGKPPRLWDVTTKAEVPLPAMPPQLISGKAFFHKGRLLLIELHDQTISLLDQTEGRELCRLVSVGSDAWLVVAPDGRFDTNSIEEIRGIHWIMPDDPLTPLSPEVFMRDYYEPDLLPRLLDGATFREVPPLASLNRVRPEVKVIAVRPEEGREDRVSVKIEVTEGANSMPGNDAKASITSGAYDLRLLRDGQLVGYKPGNLQLGVSGKTTVEFAVRLPRRTDPGDIEFTAYAFNSDRVKSATAKSTYKPAHPLSAVKGRAYVISIGVSAYEDPTWDLSFAARDAQVSEDMLSEKLAATGEYEVVTLRLTSQRGKTENNHVETTKLATRQNFQTVLDLLAHGPEKVDPKLFKEIPGLGKLRKAEPEDLVLISFSSHGYTDRHGKFYLVPYDTGSEVKFSQDGQEIAAESLSHLISSDDLSEWVRDIDAGELVMIVDTCHSASAVEEPGFKPGPMGSRGMGQLAYDKGMRLLAASQADDVALEVEKLQQGLLTYALMQDGLGKGQADKNRDGRITLDEWLTYGAERVPALYYDVKAGRVSELKDRDVHITGVLTGPSVKRSAFQQPQLFDFKRKNRNVLLANTRAAVAPG